MNCPKCGVTIDTTDLAKALAAKGGRAGRGHVKARSTEQARAAAKVRWDKVDKAKAERLGCSHGCQDGSESPGLTGRQSQHTSATPSQST